MGTTTLSGPLLVGPNKDPGDPNNPFNQGFVQLAQVVPIPFAASATKAEVEIFLPPGAIIIGFNNDVLTVFNSSGASTLTAGITTGATTYMGSVDVKGATGRIAPTYTAAQLAAMDGVTLTGVAAPTPGPLFLTVTSTGAPTTGYVQVTVLYIQTV